MKCVQHRKNSCSHHIHPAVATLTRQRFAQLLKDLAQAAKVDEDRVSPHILRHAFATAFAK